MFSALKKHPHRRKEKENHKSFKSGNFVILLLLLLMMLLLYEEPIFSFLLGLMLNFINFYWNVIYCLVSFVFLKRFCEQTVYLVGHFNKFRGHRLLQNDSQNAKM